MAVLSRRQFLLGASALAALSRRATWAAEVPVPARAIAVAAFDQHQRLHRLGHYTGILSLQALARLAVTTGEAALLERARAELRPFVRGEVKFRGNFPNYLCGGNGAAFLLWRGHLPEAAEPVRHHVELILRAAPRSTDGLITMPSKAGTDAIFIDAAFAVCPFLAFASRAFSEAKYLDEAVDQVTRLVAILRDPQNGLLHQARGFSRPGRVTGDHWSRGNGWGLLALTEVLDAMPADHPRRGALTELTRGLLEACLRVQDPAGLWHQELTLGTSYVETSGSGLILYALGVGLVGGWVPAATRAAFERGLAAYRGYIDADGSVRNTCTGCLSPGAGEIADYIARPAATNDPHAFGPVTLAFGVAEHVARKLGPA